MGKSKTPLLFIGHGSPLNIIADNDFVRSLSSFGASLPLPDAILVVSAHWLTEGSYVTSGREPEQMYDFYGFPPDLYQIVYQAPGSPEIAGIVEKISGESILCDAERGIDHAAWAVLKHLFPHADVPVLELSLDKGRLASYHFEFARRLKPLRESNVLIIGSGNIVHNLYEIDARMDAAPFPWAVEFDDLVKDALSAKRFDRLVDYPNLGSFVRKAIPTNEHYLPMLYLLALADKDETVNFIHESVQNGSISMRSFVIS